MSKRGVCGLQFFFSLEVNKHTIDYFLVFSLKDVEVRLVENSALPWVSLRGQ